MTDHTLEEVIRKARKDYYCDACYLLRELVNVTAEAIARDLGCTQPEMESLKKAEANKWRIKKGDKYSYWKGIFDNEFCESHAIPEILDIVAKYNVNY